MKFGETCMIDEFDPGPFTDAGGDYAQSLNDGVPVSFDAERIATTYANGVLYDQLPEPEPVPPDEETHEGAYSAIPELVSTTPEVLIVTAADDVSNDPADRDSNAEDSDESTQAKSAEVEEAPDTVPPKTADAGSGGGLKPPGSETDIGDAGDDHPYPALEAAYRDQGVVLPGRVLGEVDAEPSEPTIARGQPLLQEVERMREQGASYPAVEAAYNITVPEVLGEVALEDTGLPGEEDPHTVPEVRSADMRTWITYPIPQGLLHNTDGSNSFFVDAAQIRAQAEAVGTPEAPGEVTIFVYNSLDYRMHIALANGGDRYAGRAQEFNGRDRLAATLRPMGRVGDKVEACIGELENGQLEHVGDFGNRWFVGRRADDGNGNPKRIRVDYYCLEEVTWATFDRYHKGLDPTQYDVNGALFSGATEGDEAGESGRGIPLIAAYAEHEEDESAGIEWIEPPQDAEATDQNDPNPEGDRWTHLWFTVDDTEYVDNPKAPDKMSKEEKDEFIARFLKGQGLEGFEDDPIVESFKKGHVAGGSENDDK